MLFLCLLVSVGLAMKVAVQPKAVSGLGIYASVGTPGRDVFFTADFGISNTRLYLMENVRAVSLPDHQSSSSVVTDNGFMKDDLRLGGLKFGSYKFKTQFEPDLSDLNNQMDSEGRLALSPMSQIGKLRTIHACMDSVRSSGGRGEMELTLDFLADVADKPDEVVDVVLPTSTRGLNGWFVRSKVSLNGQSISGGLTDIEIDPTIVGMRLSPSALENVVSVLRKTSPLFSVGTDGFLLAPCDSRGTYTYPINFQVEMAGQEFLIQMRNRGTLPTTSESGTFLCRADIMVDLLEARSDQIRWKIDPFLVPDVGEVFFNGNRANETPRIVFRLNRDQRVPARLDRIAPPQFTPMYDRWEYEIISNKEARLVFRPVGPDALHRYTPLRRVPARMVADGISFSLHRASPLTGSELEPISTLIEGSFEIDKNLQLRFDRETGSVSIPMKIATGKLRRSSAPRYSLSIEQLDSVIVVLFRPVTSSSHNELSASLLAQDMNKINGDITSIGDPKTKK